MDVEVSTAGRERGRRVMNTKDLARTSMRQSVCHGTASVSTSGGFLQRWNGRHTDNPGVRVRYCSVDGG